MDDLTFNIIFVIATGLVAWHGLTYRDKEGDTVLTHLLFGSIALLYSMWVLLSDILGLF